MKAEQAAALVGKPVRWKAKAQGQRVIQVACLAINVRYRWGTWDLLLVPLVGFGSRWCASSDVEEAPEYGGYLSAEAVAELEKRANAENGLTE